MAEPLVAVLAGEADLEGFRRRARECLADAVHPSNVHWQVATRAEGDLFDATPDEASTNAPHQETAGTPVPGFFLPLFERAALHAEPDRFDLLYRLLWRLVHDTALRNHPLDAPRF